MVRKVPLVVLTPHPQGGVRFSGTISTGATYATVCSRVITSGKRFHICKLIVSCTTDALYKLQFGGTDLGQPVYLPAKTPFPDWFAWNAYECIGDGSKAFALLACYPSGGSTGTFYGEVHGEEA